MKDKIIETYEDYSNKIGDRKSLYKEVVKEYNIKSAVYPGSHIDIAPSMVIPKVIYIDNFKGAIKFFKEIDKIEDYINAKKEYSEKCYLSFIAEDYREEINIDKVDLIISQFAGFVGQDTKEHLKIGGILLANDSHGDATLAYKDDDFELIAIAKNNHKIVTKDLDKYFKLAKDKVIDTALVKRTMKGLKYTLRADNYIFRKIK